MTDEAKQAIERAVRGLEDAYAIVQGSSDHEDDKRLKRIAMTELLRALELAESLEK